MKLNRLIAYSTGWILGGFVLAALLPQSALAGYCWNYSSEPANQPLPWVTDCESISDGEFSAGETAGQTIGHEHRNWHCSNPVPGSSASDDSKAAYGRAFLAFHRQFILDFDNWRLDNIPSLGVLDIWNPYEDALVPGDDESTTEPFTHCSACGVSGCNASSSYRRAAGAICSDCVDLPAAFTTDLGDFNSLGELGYELETVWHTSYHTGVASISPGCRDITTFKNTTRDPAFWMAHKKLDEIARDWQTLQAADVVLVIDRSGSMDDNCTSSTPPPDESPCAINDARESALAFADLVPDSDGHQIGVVSFSDSAITHLALTAASSIVTGNDIDDTPFEINIASLSSGGFTSIGSGVEAALAVLGGGTNAHQAMLVLTDGKENTAPCLVSGASSCSGSEVAESAYGDAQVVAIGFGAGAEETALRTISERHGGIFIAQQNLLDAASDLDPNKLLKFFVNAFGEIFDEAASVDPDGVMLHGQTVSAPFPINVCGENGFTVFLGREASANTAAGSPTCDLRLDLFTPNGVLVDRAALGVEDGHGPRHDFMRVQLPYGSESTGQWTGRVVRLGPESCEDQRYFYTIMTPGLGRVKSFPLKPRLTLGQELTASFRLTESFNPHDYWDVVTGEVVVTGPRGESATYTLYDDGTNGDETAGNNTWVRRVPGAVTVPGAYHVRGLFELTRNGCTTTREAVYAIIAEGQPAVCADLATAPVLQSVAGGTNQLNELGCVWNTCADGSIYDVTIVDSKGWLFTEDAQGALTPATGTQTTTTLAPGEHLCFGGAGGAVADLPFHLAIPAGTPVGAESLVQIVVSSANQNLNLQSSTTLRVMALPDCNGNNIHDSLDIENGTSQDANHNGVPDECPDEAFFGHAEAAPDTVPALFGSWRWAYVGSMLATGLLLILWRIEKGPRHSR